MPLEFSLSRSWMQRFFQPVLLSACLLAAAGAASAATLNVPTSTYPTIQSAIDASSDGDTVMIADGIYGGPGNIDVDFNGRNITVTSQHGAAATIIDCGNGSTNHRAFFLHNGETSAAISGLTIEDGYENGDTGGAISNASAVTVTDCNFTGNYADNGGSIFNNGTMTLINCVFTNSSAYIGGGFFNNNTATVTNCTFTGNVDDGSEGAIYDNSGATTLVNDILWGDSGETNASSVTYSDVQGGYSGAGNINADPQFASASDFHLQATSPCLTTGTSAGAPATDFDGAMRSSPPSMGAFNDPPPTLQSITITPAPVSVSAGHTQQFTATGNYPYGGPQDLSSQVTWTSSRTGVATISSSGFATSLTAGTTNITAALGSVTSAPAVLTVTAHISPLYVSPAGNDANDGSLGSPKLTIQAAINAALSGDTVIAEDGTYTGPGNMDIDFSGKNLTVTSQNGAATTIIDCGGSSNTGHRGFILHSNETSAVISGLTIQNAYQNNGDGGGIYNSSTVTVSNCLFTSDSALDAGGILNAGTITVTNCTFTGDSAINNTGGGLYNSGSATATITGCTFTGCTSLGDGGGVGNDGTLIAAGCTFIRNIAPSEYGGGGINTNNTATITNCVFAGNTAGQGGGIKYNGDATVTNCTLTGNTASQSGSGLYETGGAATLVNTILYGDTTDEINAANLAVINCDVQGTGNIDADPKFVSGTDFHLQPTSPCLGMGTSNGAPLTDFDGVTRPIPPSIGAYELPVLQSLTASPSFSILSDGATQQLVITAHVSDGSSHVVTDSTFTSDTTSVATVSISGLVTAVAASGTATITAAEGGLTTTVVITDVPFTGYEALWACTDGQFSFWEAALGGGFAPHDFDAVPNFSAHALAMTPDGHAHLLLTAADGSISLGDTPVATLGRAHNSAALTTYGPFSGWTAQTVAAGPDGAVRVLWMSTSGQMSLWKVHSDGTYDHAEYGPYPGWTARFLSAAPDSTLRVLWTNTSGQVSFWVMDAAGTYQDFEYGPYPGWTPSALATGPDGASYLTWNHDGDGLVSVWSLSDSGLFAYVDFGPFSDWTAGAVTVGADDTLHLGWSEPNGTGSLWDILPTDPASFTEAAYGPYTGWQLQGLSAAP